MRPRLGSARSRTGRPRLPGAPDGGRPSRKRAGRGGAGGEPADCGSDPTSCRDCRTASEDHATTGCTTTWRSPSARCKDFVSRRRKAGAAQMTDAQWEQLRSVAGRAAAEGSHGQPGRRRSRRGGSRSSARGLGRRGFVAATASVDPDQTPQKGSWAATRTRLQRRSPGPAARPSPGWDRQKDLRLARLCQADATAACPGHECHQIRCCARNELPHAVVCGAQDGDRRT